MTQGGARSQSGPVKSATSGRSDRAGFAYDTLPADGYQGVVPEWPLPDSTERELELWESVWRLPQGHLWSRPAFRWLLFSVALYVRQAAKCEHPMVKAAQLAQFHRLAEQVGMSPAGLSRLGFRVAPVVEVEPSEPSEPSRPTSLERAARRSRDRITRGDAS